MEIYWRSRASNNIFMLRRGRAEGGNHNEISMLLVHPQAINLNVIPSSCKYSVGHNENLVFSHNLLRWQSCLGDIIRGGSFRLKRVFNDNAP